MNNSSEYEKAVLYRGGNVAVSASAGCGKTTTMIRRIEDIIRKENIEITNLLIVTFTRAAAADTKQKLKNQLIKHPKNSFAYSQIKNLEIADISTIHSFCSKVCSEFFNVADIPPDFTILEENDSVIYKNKILRDTVEQYYKDNDSIFSELSQIFTTDRTDEGLIYIIEELYRLTVCMTDAEKYLMQTATMLCEKDLDKNEAVKLLNDDLSEAVNDFVYDITAHLSLCEKYNLNANLPMLKSLKSELLGIDKHNEIKKNLLALEKAIDILGNKILSEKKLEKESIESKIHERTKKLKGYLKEELEKKQEYIQSVFAQNLTNKLDNIKIYITKLCEVTLNFRNSFLNFKKEKSLLDFNDLEYYTLKVLNNAECREILKNRYRFIFVDEFQDTNRIQDEIINLMEKELNLFLVGDFKQSIYRFRGAENEIFKEKTQSNTFEQITLGTNFRSDKKLLAFINTIFSFAMRENFSLINYSLNGMLTGDNSYKLFDNRPPVIIDILLPPENNSVELKGLYSVKNHAEIVIDDELNAAANEGKHICASIKRLIGTKIDLPDKELEQRKECGKDDTVCFDDITILVRAKKAFTEQIYSQLLKSGIPVAAEFSYSINEYFEITQLLNYLKLIDNFKQDIPLLAVLKGCFGKFSDDEIADIRIKYRQGSFYEAFLCYVKDQSGELALRLIKFLQKIKDYSLLSKSMPCPRLLMKIIKDYNYEEYLLTLDNGADCVNRVDTFLSIIYQKAYSYNLTEFLKYLEYASQDIKLGFKTGSELNKVHLCTIHNSKGLEYPIVFLAGCGQKFLFSESRKKLLMHRKYGIAMDYYDTDNRKKENSFIRYALSILHKYEQVKEEINTLYVAMTRAKYRLYLCGTANIEKYTPLTGIYSIKNASTYFDFILNVAMQDAKNALKSDNNLYFNNNFGLDYEFNVNNAEIFATELRTQKSVYEEILPVKDYKFLNSTTQPLKNSVTSLNKYTEIFENEIENVNNIFEGDRADVGRFYHKILSEIDFSCSLSDIENYLNKLATENLITAEKHSGIDAKIILNVINMTAIKNNKGQIYREIPFMTVLKCTETGGKTDDDILVQGVIDLLIVNGNNAEVYDFKLSTKSNTVLAQRYNKQLDLYSLAVEKVLGYKVVKKAIINIIKAEEIILNG